MHGAVEVCDCLDQRGQRAKAVEERASRLNELEVVEHTVVASEGQGAHHALDAVRPVEGGVSGRKTENERKNKNSHQPVQRISGLSALLQLVDDGLPLVERQIGFRLQRDRHSADDRLQLHRRRDDLGEKPPVLDLQGGQLLLDRLLRQRACQRHQDGGSSRQEANSFCMSLIRCLSSRSVAGMSSVSAEISCIIAAEWTQTTARSRPWASSSISTVPIETSWLTLARSHAWRCGVRFLNF